MQGVRGICIGQGLEGADDEHGVCGRAGLEDRLLDHIDPSTLLLVGNGVGQVAAQPVGLCGQRAERDVQVVVGGDELTGLGARAAGVDHQVLDTGEQFRLGDRLRQRGLESRQPFQIAVLVVLFGPHLAEGVAGDRGVRRAAGADRLGETVDAEHLASRDSAGVQEVDHELEGQDLADVRQAVAARRGLGEEIEGVQIAQQLAQRPLIGSRAGREVGHARDATGDQIGDAQFDGGADGDRRDQLGEIVELLERGLRSLGVGHRLIRVESHDFPPPPVADELDVLLRHASVFHQMTTDVSHRPLLSRDPRERPAFLPAAAPDGVQQVCGRARLGAVAHEPRHLDAGQLAQRLSVLVLGDLDEYLRPRVLGQLIEQAGDRGDRRVISGDQEPRGVERESTRRRRPEEVDAVADLGAVRPRGAHADAVLDEVDVQLTVLGVPATHGVDSRQRPRGSRHLEALRFLHRQHRLGVARVAEHQTDVIVESG